MKVLVLGAAGFVGRHIAEALENAGHEVVRGLHGEIDFERDIAVTQWLPRLKSIDAVANAVGIFQESRGRSFAALHDAAPRALFAACEQAGVRKVVQISALGADAAAESDFHRSKKIADDDLAARNLDWVIIQPSLVFGPDGASARLFAMLASLPVIPLPGDGGQRVQPIHVEDVAAVVVRVLSDDHKKVRIPAVGPRAVTVREWLAVIRKQLKLPDTRFVHVPLALVRVATGGETLRMLLRGNTASPELLVRVLGRAPRPVEAFVPQKEGEALRTRARLDWLLPLLRASVAVVWIMTGIVSLGLYPVADSLAMLSRVGLTGALALVTLYAAAILDIALGVGVYVLKQRRWLWRLQIAVMLAYSAIIALRLPELWLHPFGPLLKNLPMLAAILVLHEFDEPG